MSKGFYGPGGTQDPIHRLNQKIAELEEKDELNRKLIEGLNRSISSVCKERDLLSEEIRSARQATDSAQALAAEVLRIVALLFSFRWREARALYEKHRPQGREVGLV